MVERRTRRRRDGTTYSVWRTRWRDERRRASKTFDRATDARAVLEPPLGDVVGVVLSPMPLVGVGLVPHHTLGRRR